ncbi:class II fructose-bisphosphate aldolase [Amycolatopsis thermophila]|nr:class II fructose-bisphosphate aldolase [Amycolatopsis thermophila]
MRAALDDVVARRLNAGTAVPAFTCYGTDTALAVVDAAERLRLPVVLLVAPSSAGQATGPKLIRTLRHIVDDAAVEVCVRLDHAKDEALIRRAIEAGADSVLADGSHLPPTANAEFVRQVREFAAPLGVVVEAELGSVPGDEARAAAPETATAGKTDPATARPFLNASGAQLLACGVGNVHDKYSGVPALDWPRPAAVPEQAGARGAGPARRVRPFRNRPARGTRGRDREGQRQHRTPNRDAGDDRTRDHWLPRGR